MSNSRTMAGKVAIITGAGPGLGRSCALALAEDGADLALAARRAEPLKALAAEVAAATGRRVLAIPTDIAHHDSAAAMADTAAAELGRVDAVVNVATAGGARAAVADIDWGDYRYSFELNVVGTLEVSRRAAEHMKTTGGGSIVQISTLSTHSVPEKMAIYTSTKSAMHTASMVMARELGPHNIRVNIVTPGYITGDNLDRLWQGIADQTGKTAQQVSERAARSAALRRHVDPDDIAEAVLFLASERGRGVTGLEIRVDAGQMIG
ncbi:MAG: SDR family oxidoreductase [Acidimicrobiia bacterium]|nr:SDR family oxidoreductase [Acidimicrobiia bacterium]MCY4433170.1 SDR family oxidoreductase [bacterium]